jgi:PucR-like helix-turn-helix protein/diguanylate cyclase with GGDEF domain
MEALPQGVADVLRPALPALSDEIVEAIGHEIDAYARPLEGPFGQAVRLGVERALSRFVDLAVDPGAADESGRRIYVGLGRAEFREGRSLDALLAAYRLGARIAWRRSVEAGTAAGLPPETMYQVGEAIFAYIDGLSAESAEGFAEAQSAAAGERQQRRRQLIALLQQRPLPDDRVVQTAAAEAGWELPRTLAAVVVAGDEDTRVATRLGPDAIATSRNGIVVALVPDPGGPGRAAQLERALNGRSAAIGPAVDWRATGESVARAELAHRLAADGVLPDGGVVRADDHLPLLVLHADPALAQDLAGHWLAPIDEVSGAARVKLRETLAAWLDHRGRVEEVARELGIHSQTVRYRLKQLRGLFGDALDDPDGRFALQLALRAGGESARTG